MWPAPGVVRFARWRDSRRCWRCRYICGGRCPDRPPAPDRKGRHVRSRAAAGVLLPCRAERADPRHSGDTGYARSRAVRQPHPRRGLHSAWPDRERGPPVEQERPILWRPEPRRHAASAAPLYRGETNGGASSNRGVIIEFKCAEAHLDFPALEPRFGPFISVDDRGARSAEADGGSCPVRCSCCRKISPPCKSRLLCPLIQLGTIAIALPVDSNKNGARSGPRPVITRFSKKLSPCRGRCSCW